MKLIPFFAGLVLSASVHAQSEMCGRVTRVFEGPDFKAEMKFPNDPTTYTVEGSNISTTEDRWVLLASQALVSSDKAVLCIGGVDQTRNGLVRTRGPVSLKSID